MLGVHFFAAPCIKAATQFSLGHRRLNWNVKTEQL